MNLPPNSSIDQNFADLVKYRLRHDRSRKAYRRLALFLQVSEEHVRGMHRWNSDD